MATKQEASTKEDKLREEVLCLRRKLAAFESIATDITKAINVAVSSPIPAQKSKRVAYEWRRGTTRRGLPHMSDNTSGHVNVVVLLGLGYTVGPWSAGAGALPAFKESDQGGKS